MSTCWKQSAADPCFKVLQPGELRLIVPQDLKVWRSIAERTGDEGLHEGMHDEFAARAACPPDEATRRQFLQLMGASIALATASGCLEQPHEPIVPYVRAPEQIVPGRPLYYATAMTYCGASIGLLAETHMGRPTKVEGNPLHPAVPEVMREANERGGDNRLRFGATDAFGQAMVLSLYDPDRSQTVLRGGQIDTWDLAFNDLRTRLEKLAADGGQGLRLLTEIIVSPTLADQIQQLLQKYPNARWHQYEPINDDSALAGSRIAFGENVTPIYIGQPDVVLSLDADCLAEGPMHLQHARNFRWQNLASGAMSRLYVVESSLSLTGGAAEHRLPLGQQRVVHFALALAQSMGLELGADPAFTTEQNDDLKTWLDAVVEDLNAARGRSVVIAGRGQPPVVHAIAHWLNVTLGNVGRTVEYHPPVAERGELCVESIRELAAAMRGREVSALVILGGNPAYDAPADLEFGKLLASVPFSLHLSQYEDETSALCTWHVPAAHLLESWSDTRAADGTVSIVQPLIAPLYSGKTVHEVLAALLGLPVASSHDIVREFWRSQISSSAEQDEFERIWQTALHDGVMANTNSQAVTPSVVDNFMASTSVQEELRRAFTIREPTSRQIVFLPDPSAWDGRFANNAWLQELPRPFTKLTWDNAALISPRTAEELRLKTGDVAQIETSAGAIEIPVFVVPGQPRETITVHVGYGRSRAGRVGNRVGTNVYPLRTSDSMWTTDVTSIRKTGRTYPLVTTQHHHLMHGRDLVRAGTLQQYLADPAHPPFMAHGGHAAPDGSLYPEPHYDGYKWGMVVNQSACIGCNACVVACQAENNIPVVGKDQVARGREMHWLRIDNYYQGKPENPEVYHQPMMCVHCEYAPCEPVCPVAATSHSNEGINEMTYNRCIGTRYCANNCPYKVRRFNFYDYNADLRANPVLQLRPNPDVTVRSRGVMEKCTYCVQRINVARIAADKEDRRIRDGEMITACQAACPTQAITFGDLNDPASAVRRLAASGLNYSVLGELNTRPRTTYHAVVRNPNPALAQLKDHSA